MSRSRRRPTTPNACASVSSCADAVEVAGALAHRGRRHASAADAAGGVHAGRRAPGRRAPPGSSRRSSGGGRRETANPTTRHRVCRRGPRSPIRLGPATARSSHVDASRYQRLAVGGLDEPVGGHRRRPVRSAAVERVGLRHARRDQARPRRRPRGSSPSRWLVDAGDLDQPLDVAHPEPAAAQFGDRCSSTGSRAPPRPRAAGRWPRRRRRRRRRPAFVVVTTGSGGVECARALADSPRIT